MKWCLAKVTTILNWQLLRLLLLQSYLSATKASLGMTLVLKTKQHETNKVSPTQLRKNIPHLVPSVDSLNSICPIDSFLDKTFYFPHDNICWKVDFSAEYGLLQGDIANPACLNNVYVATDTYSFLDSRDLDQKKDATFQFGRKGEGYSGVIEVKTSNVNEFKAIVVSKNDVMKTFQIDFLVPDCSNSPPMPYHMSPKKLKSISDLRRLQRSSLKVRIEIIFIIELS